MSDQEEKRPLWERQPWDTDGSFSKFQIYYLSQLPPRSLDEAYRQYLRTRHKDAPETQLIEILKRRPDGAWVDWFYGRNTKHQPLPGAVGWQARARAYDDHIWAERREWHKRKSWEIVEAGFEKVTAMLAHPIVRQRITQKDENGRPVTYIIEPTNWRGRDAATLFSVFDKSARLDLGEPTDRTAVSGAADYTQLTEDQLNDAIARLMAQSGTAATRELTSPSFGEGEPSENYHEGEFEEG